ncbi:hypothetical protein P3T76_016215 [Phytophthora citrophthora]|uniref:FYVE-type domain-containing protein n=1 Tax=Phytophthora citrophthora TaxID=4793 RepID=A0AAD9FXZ8_9STRA|nr:hypothetical protein P3T76_016215 [Phytophthora citrophthora]
MMTGFARGKVENAMDAVTSKSQEDLALMLSFMHHDDVVDCAVLKTIETPTETDPFHFLGIKYFVRKAPVAGTRLLKHRDSVYLEFTGYTETTRGERLGFHLMHSVELSTFPPLTARNSVRTLHSVRYLYRQQSEDVVEVFMQGNLDIPGLTVKPFASTFLDDALFGLATLVACAEAKRLTQMWRAQQTRQDTRRQQSKRVSMALECSMCRQKRKLFGGASLAACKLCADAVCTRCRSDKKVFEMDANRIIGRFRKLSVCKSCILAANRALSQPDEPQMLIVMSEHLQLDREGSRDRRRRGASSSGSSGTRSRSDSSCPSASSEDLLTPQLQRRDRNESVASSASTVSSQSVRECPVVPVSPMGMHTRAHGHQLVYTVNDQQMELQQQRRANAVKTSTERAHRIQQFSNSRRVQQQQLTLREHQLIALQPPDTKPTREQALVSRSHRDYALRRVASTGTAFASSSSGAYTHSTTPSSQSQQNDLFARMVELNRVAESTYNTTQQNGAFLSQQMRSRRRRGT